MTEKDGANEDIDLLFVIIKDLPIYMPKEDYHYDVVVT